MQTYTPWSTFQKIIFRFVAIYFFLYAFPFFKGINFIWDPIVKLTGKLIGMPVDITTGSTGSGDGLYEYMLVLSIAVIAFIGCILWSVIDWRRNSYNQAFYWLMVLIRYVLAFFLILYGISKCLDMQFRPPSIMQLERSYGMFTPMGLAWKFLGYSKGYTLFIGISQALAGVLLFFRRTTLLGSVLAVVVLSNVFAVNMFFDVPVKLFSLHLLLMAILVMLPDIGRMFRFFLGAQPVARQSYVSIQWLDKNADTREWLKAFVLAIAVVLITIAVWPGSDKKEPGNVMDGIYKVTKFVTTVDTALSENTYRWHRLAIKDNMIYIRSTDDSTAYFNTAFDTTLKNVVLSTREDKDVAVLYYEMDKNNLVLKGKFFRDSIYTTLKKRDVKEYPLMNHSFRWVNEYPDNQ